MNNTTTDQSSDKFIEADIDWERLDSMYSEVNRAQEAQGALINGLLDDVSEVLEAQRGSWEAIQQREDEIKADAEALAQVTKEQIDAAAGDYLQPLSELQAEKEAAAEQANKEALEYVLSQVKIGGTPLAELLGGAEQVVEQAKL